MNYYQHHIGDFNNATLHLTEIEECMYHRALAWYYSNERPLPKDKVQIYRYLRARTTATKKAVDVVLSDFFTEQDDGWHQSRCDEELATYHANAKASRENGAKGGRPPKANTKPSETKDHPESNPDETQHKPNINPEETQAKGNQEPITKNQEPYNTHSIAGEFLPDLKVFNDTIRAAGGQAVTQQQLDQTLVLFRPNYETKVMTHNQLMAKLVQWIKGDQDKAKRPAIKPVTTKPSSGAVNQHWPEAQYTIPPSPETLAAVKKMQDEMEDIA